ncbi:peroxisomal membrane protein 11A isoform X1 [Balearica regulorum gibbericeps]|uniref:peroxisomal membrane protein 11A isoform X1 n=1 Tax=Balearica regulorum gibbericeps TaxID=100784 RepID=UPI003F630448
MGDIGPEGTQMLRTEQQEKAASPGYQPNLCVGPGLVQDGTEMFTPLSSLILASRTEKKMLKHTNAQSPLHFFKSTCEQLSCIVRLCLYGKGQAMLTFVGFLAVFRLGNMVHALVAARKTTQLPNVVPRFCLTASNLTRALYFVCDAVLWLKSVGLQPDIDKPKWRNWATKCYYFSILMNLARDGYEISWRLEQAVQEEKTKENSFCDKRSQELNCVKCDSLHGFLLLLFQILKRHPPLLLDLVKNLCNLSGPLDTLGIYKTNPGVIGFCGILSSLVGILTLASPHLKLKH